ncbi:hypothetical protein [Streptococcus uberis]|uniref:hypothetical protein n=1 Tax=Streptococcus uberis TaxID=1349 RepID=UPI001FF4AAE7|nr:hypothetical protein [Streptococcus uberis]MCK1165208.1 hypothetical protein [Streptococcus uberis]MCK1190078.1 hypothetical protein [Streptococcus uberis]MCK1251384.1 hypothetical protein [Streptococcus uberis]
MRYSYIDINQFIKPLKQQKLRRGKGKIGDKYLEISLNDLYIIISNERLDLSKIEGTYGGERFFFVCSNCFNNARKLYKSNGGFYKCGKCSGIYSQTLNRTKTDCTYYWDLAEKEIQKLDPSYHSIDYLALMDDFPNRPKYMRKEKYLKHKKKFQSYYQKGYTKWLSGIKALSK